MIRTKPIKRPTLPRRRRPRKHHQPPTAKARRRPGSRRLPNRPLPAARGRQRPPAASSGPRGGEPSQREPATEAWPGKGAISERFERIYATIAAIPKGSVAAYGDVAEEAGIARGARQVAAALRQLPKGRSVPWHRVILASGKVAPRPGEGFRIQIQRLRSEGVAVDGEGRVAREHRHRFSGS